MNEPEHFDHSPDPDPAWQEAAYFFFLPDDPDAHTIEGGFCYAQRRASFFYRTLGIMQRDQLLLHVSLQEIDTPFPFDWLSPDELQAQAHDWSCRSARPVDPLQEWPVWSEATQPVTLDLIFRPAHERYELQGRFEFTHYQQLGRVEGTLRLPTQELTITGQATRDHTVGVRRWSQVGELWQVQASFGEDLGLHFAYLQGHVFGLLMSGGRNRRLVGARMTQGPPDPIRFLVEDEDGETHSLDLFPRIAVRFPVASGDQSYASSEMAAEVHWDGRRTRGYVGPILPTSHPPGQNHWPFPILTDKNVEER
jgi:hypothetical protein